MCSEGLPNLILFFPITCDKTYFLQTPNNIFLHKIYIMFCLHDVQIKKTNMFLNFEINLENNYGDIFIESRRSTFEQQRPGETTWGQG